MLGVDRLHSVWRLPRAARRTAGLLSHRQCAGGPAAKAPAAAGAWWSERAAVGVAVVGVVGGLWYQQKQGFEQYKQSDEYKIDCAAKKLMEPYKTRTQVALQPPVARPAATGPFKVRLAQWTYGATVVAGQFGAGKSVMVENSLEGLSGIWHVEIRDDEWQQSMLARLGLEERHLEPLLESLAAKLKAQGAPSQAHVPIIILDVGRYSRITDMRSVSAFAKAVCVNSSLAHPIILASLASNALAFDMGGVERQDNIFIRGMTADEGKELVVRFLQREKHTGNDPAKIAEELIQQVGTNPLALVSSCYEMVKGKSLQEAIGLRRFEAKTALLNLRSIALKNDKEEIVEVGKLIIETLQQRAPPHAADAGVPHEGSPWDLQGIRFYDILSKLRQPNVNSHAVVYDFTDGKWYWASPAHSLVAKDL